MFRVQLILRMTAATLVVGAVLFVSAGRIDLPFFWAYLAVLAGVGILIVATLPRELLEERMKPAEGGRDSLALLRAVAGAVFVSQIVLAGLDAGRFHWTVDLPTWLRVVGLAGHVAVFATWYWAMRTNPFFSAAVRIQRDRGHYVVTSGPYRFVRHPGYASFVLFGWGGPVALGSWWAAALHVVFVVLFVRRAALEDRMLRDELKGYADYAVSVRSRLLPGLW